jgi:hypothetical protein
VLEERTVLSTFQVTSTADSGSGSLRQLIQNAVSGDTITFDPTVFSAPQTINLTSQLSVTKNLAILGLGAKTVTVSGGVGVRVFLISAANVTLDGLTLANAVLGSLQNGGAIQYTGSGTLTVSNCALTNNSANSAGGIYNSGGGTVNLINCTLSGNQAGGGGVAGAIWNQGGTLNVTNSTLSGNISNTNEAGGIWNSNSGTTTLLNTTIFNNRSRLVGGGVWNQSGTVQVKNSIIAGNTSTNTISQDVSGGFTSQGNNLIGDTDGSAGFGGSDLTGTGAAPRNPQLSPLGDYGGPTQTNPPLPGSPAIDAGNNAGAPAADQRGIARPFGPAVDIGSVEADRHYFTVRTTADSGPGSLRQALLDANAAPNLPGGPDLIQFAIPGSGVHTITPLSALPNITDTVILDGSTQPGSAPNTQTVGDNAVLEIQLNGTLAGSGVSGLTLQGPGGSVVRGLSLTGFSGTGIVVSSTGNVIEGNFIGLLPNGTTSAGNGGDGIQIVSAASNLVGGSPPPARNLLSGNAGSGVDLLGVGTTGNLVQGNLIGTDRTGTASLGNGRGALVQGGAANNTIGGTSAGQGNVIAFNPKGVVVTGSTSTGNGILGNSIFANSILGIDLGDDGITPNGTLAPGPNNFQGNPVLFTASGTTITGNLAAAANTTYRLEFFSSPASGPHRQGQTFLGATNVTTDGSGNANFLFTVGAPLGAGVVTATATNLTTGDTSEFSAGPPVLLTASAGTGQGTTVNTLFGSPLTALVTDAYNDPTAGIPVTFTAPALGASVTFGTSLTAQATTNSFGLATSPAMTANTVAGSYSVSAAFGGMFTSFGLQNIAGPAVSFSVAGFPASAQAGVAQSFTITALDSFGNVATAYAGTVVVTSSDPSASLPGPLFFAGQGGMVVTSATLKTAGPQSLTASDGVLSGTETGIVISPAPFAAIGLSPLPASPYAQGGVFPLLVAALDPFGNIDPNYTGTVTFTSDDPWALLPPPTTFGPTDAGARIVFVAFITPGSHSITARDTGSGVTATQGPVTVVNVPPVLARHPGVFLNLTGQLVTDVSFADAGTENEFLTVDFGDNTPVQTLQVSGTTRTVTLSHLYTADASFVVDVNITDEFGGHDEITFLANVFLPDIKTIAIGVVQPGGNTATVATDSVMAALITARPIPPGTRPEDLPALLLADVPSDSLDALPASPDRPAAFVETSYDIRGLNLEPGDQATVLFHYREGDLPGATPIFEFYNDRTRQFEPVHGSTRVPNSLVIDKQAHTIRLILDGTSFPTVRRLTGTVFTITVPAQGSDTTTQVTTQFSSAVALATTPGSATSVSDSGSSLSSTVTLRTSSQPTVSLTPTTGGQAGDRLLTLSGSGKDDAPPEESQPVLWGVLLQFWQLLQQAATAPGQPETSPSAPAPSPGDTDRKSLPGDVSVPDSFGSWKIALDLEEESVGPVLALQDRPSRIDNPGASDLSARVDPNPPTSVPAWAWLGLVPALLPSSPPRGQAKRARKDFGKKQG